MPEQRRPACGRPQPELRRAVWRGRLGRGRGPAAVGGARTQRRARRGRRECLVAGPAACLRAPLCRIHRVRRVRASARRGRRRDPRRRVRSGRARAARPCLRTVWRHALRRDLPGTVRSHRGGSLKWAVPARGRTQSTPVMNPLKSLETTIASLVEGGFGRLFRTEVRPMELARKLAREIDEHRTASVSRVYAPNEYSVWLSPDDRARYDGVEHEVIDELCGYLLEHARREELILASPPSISFHTDEDLALGEFGLQARLVRPPQPREEPVPPVSPPPGPLDPHPPDEHGQTMIYSTSARTRQPLEEAKTRRAARALLAVGGRRLIVPPAGGTIGRSRECEIVLDDAGASRRHAEIRPDPAGWALRDLASTNGVRVNGRAIHGTQPLRQGDRVEIGSTEIVFELGGPPSPPDRGAR